MKQFILISVIIIAISCQNNTRLGVFINARVNQNVEYIVVISNNTCKSCVNMFFNDVYHNMNVDNSIVYLYGINKKSFARNYPQHNIKLFFFDEKSEILNYDLEESYGDIIFIVRKNNEIKQFIIEEVNSLSFHLYE